MQLELPPQIVAKSKNIASIDCITELPIVSKVTRGYSFIHRVPRSNCWQNPDVSMNSLLKTIQDSCCLTDLNPDFLLQERSKLLLSNAARQKVFLRVYLHLNKIANSCSHKFLDQYRWHVGRNDICYVCWHKVYCVSFFKTKNSLSLFHSRLDSKRSLIESVVAGWLQAQFLHLCDYMPNKNIQVLPTYMGWIDLYNDFKNDLHLKQRLQTTISYSYFLIIKNRFFSNVRLATYTKLGKCDDCIIMKQARLNRSLTSEQQSEIRILHKKHVDQVMMERISYEVRQTSAVQQPSKYLSLVIDHATSLMCPVQYPVPKRSSCIDRLKIHVCGVIDHGTNTRQLFYYLEYWPQNANIICTILHNHLMKLLSKKALPEYLYLQVCK